MPNPFQILSLKLNLSGVSDIASLMFYFTVTTPRLISVQPVAMGQQLNKAMDQ
jgi:hypothetical protein